MLEWKTLLGLPAKGKKKKKQPCKGSRQLAGIFYLTESNCKA